jgi:hypothetical protein
LWSMSMGRWERRKLKGVNIVDVPDAEMAHVLRLAADGERLSKFKVVLYPRAHSMFSVATGNSPATELCGVPLVVQKTEILSPLGDQCGYDNQWSTWLMIDPVSGLAPPAWQSWVGPTIVYRPGGSNLNGGDLDILVEFFGSLLDDYGEDDFDYKTKLNPEYFQKFKKRMIAERNFQNINI